MKQEERDYFRRTGQLEEYEERLNRRIKRRRKIMVITIPFSALFAIYTFIGYDLAKTLHKDGFSKKGIEQARFVENSEIFDPLKFVTKPGRELYYWVHDMK